MCTGRGTTASGAPEVADGTALPPVGWPVTADATAGGRDGLLTGPEPPQPASATSATSATPPGQAGTTAAPRKPSAFGKTNLHGEKDGSGTQQRGRLGGPFRTRWIVTAGGHPAILCDHRT